MYDSPFAFLLWLFSSEFLEYFNGVFFFLFFLMEFSYCSIWNYCRGYQSLLLTSLCQKLSSNSVKFENDIPYPVKVLFLYYIKWFIGSSHKNWKMIGKLWTVPKILNLCCLNYCTWIKRKIFYVKFWANVVA